MFKRIIFLTSFLVTLALAGNTMADLVVHWLPTVMYTFLTMSAPMCRMIQQIALRPISLEAHRSLLALTAMRCSSMGPVTAFISRIQL